MKEETCHLKDLKCQCCISDIASFSSNIQLKATVMKIMDAKSGSNYGF